MKDVYRRFRYIPQRLLYLLRRRSNTTFGAILFLVSALLAGCAVFKEESYFLPTRQQQVIVVKTWRGFEELVQFQPGEGMKMSLIVFDQPKHSSLRIILSIPAGKVVQFKSAEIVATPIDDAKGLVARVETFKGNYIFNGQGSLRFLGSTEELEGSSYEYKKLFGEIAVVDRYFETDVPFAVRLPDQFRITVPTFALSGRTITLPVVEFKRNIGSAYQGSPP